MRLRIVVRSLAVILASPLIALPMGQAQTPESPQLLPVIEPARELAPKAMVHAAVVAHERPQAPRPVTEISVACGNDGCVVQNGLEVMVVAGKRAR